MDTFTRWAQTVRKPGSFLVHDAYAVQVPPLNSQPPYPELRNGVRLVGHPVDMSSPAFTIDVTSTATMAMLEGFIAQGKHIGKVVSWSSRGYGVRRRDTLILSKPT